MTPESLLKELNAALEERCHKGLRAESMEKAAARWELLVTCDTMLARQSLQQALSDEVVRRHLTAWSDGELLVSVLGKGHRSAEPAILIRTGELFLVSASPGATERNDSDQTLAAWFEELIGAPLPVVLALECVEDGLFGTPNTRGRKVEGLPHVMQMRGLGEYSLAGFYGYGSNSYALYVTRVSGVTRMFLRLPWGGAYMKAEEARLRLLEALREANRLFETAAQKELPMWLNNNMGEWSVAAVPEPKSRQRASWFSFDNARRYVETGKLEVDE